MLFILNWCNINFYLPNEEYVVEMKNLVALNNLLDTHSLVLISLKL